MSGSISNQGFVDLLLSGEVEKAEELRRKSVPKKLIKFVPLGPAKFGENETAKELERDKRNLDTLRQGKVWFSKKALLNDPYEFKGMILEREALRNAGYSEHQITFFDRLLNGSENRFSVYSLSANTPDCLPMWTYYANNCQGFCVEYEVLIPDHIYEVHYTSKRIPVTLLLVNYYDSYIRSLGGDKEAEKEFHGLAVFHSLQFRIKHKSWMHENEYRVLYPIENDERGIALPFSKFGVKVTRIIAGINCSEEHLQKLNEISALLGCGNVKQMRIKDDDYTLTEDA